MFQDFLCKEILFPPTVQIELKGKKDSFINFEEAEIHYLDCRISIPYISELKI